MKAAQISTGNEGLDTILRGGLPAHRLYLLEGAPGSGKTTLGLQFLRAGVARGEKALYITLSETREELAVVAASHGWNIDDFDVFELSAVEDVLGDGREQSILHPWEMELGEMIRLIQDEVERVRPARVVFDSLSEMRLLAQDPLRYRRQVLALKQFFAGRDITVVLVDDLSGTGPDSDSHLHSLCHGVVTLERLTLDFGAARRRLQVQKLRGVDFIAGFHDLAIRKGGLDIYPRLIASDHHTAFVGEPIASGVAELDRLLNGGPLRGTSTLITGPAGTGKTTIALQYLHAACERGEPSVIYEFDERIGTLLARARAFGLDIDRHIASGCLALEQVDPAELSPGEFATRVRRQVEDRGARVVVIDSLNGYLAAMPQEQQLILQLHELLSFLNQKGVATFLINPQQGLLGTMATNLNVSYIADAVLLLRFFEADGRIRKAISVLKNRAGAHEDAIREFRIDAGGVRVGAPLTAFKTCIDAPLLTISLARDRVLPLLAWGDRLMPCRARTTMLYATDVLAPGIAALQAATAALVRRLDHRRLVRAVRGGNRPRQRRRGTDGGPARRRRPRRPRPNRSRRRTAGLCPCTDRRWTTACWR